MQRVKGKGSSQPEILRISAKNLGALALPDACPRCAWLRIKMNHRLPFQIFPGIFSSIDSYTKKVVHAWFDEHLQPPAWLRELGPLTGYVEPPHWSKFNLRIEKHGILLTGAPDGIFRRPDRSLVIADYKTARFTGVQDELLPMYEVQLNGYALIAEGCGYGPVTTLALIYMEPITGCPDPAAACDDQGFSLGFSAKILRIEKQSAMVARQLARVRAITGLTEPPPSRGCKECELIERMISLKRQIVVGQAGGSRPPADQRVPETKGGVTVG